MALPASFLARWQPKGLIAMWRAEDDGGGGALDEVNGLNGVLTPDLAMNANAGAENGLAFENTSASTASDVALGTIAASSLLSLHGLGSQAGLGFAVFSRFRYTGGATNFNRIVEKGDGGFAQNGYALTIESSTSAGTADKDRYPAAYIGRSTSTSFAVHRAVAAASQVPVNTWVERGFIYDRQKTLAAAEPAIADLNAQIIFTGDGGVITEALATGLTDSESVLNVSAPMALYAREFGGDKRQWVGEIDYVAIFHRHLESLADAEQFVIDARDPSAVPAAPTGKPWAAMANLVS